MKNVLLSILFLILTLPGAGAAPAEKTIRYGEADGLTSRYVGSAVQDSRGLMWFATLNGLNCYDGYDFHWLRIRPGDRASISTNQIRDILLGDDGNLICHTYDDIFKFDLSTFTFRDLSAEEKAKYASRVGRSWKGFTDSQGNRWTADRKGLYKTVKSHTPATVLPGTEGTNPRAFLTDSAGRLLIATQFPPALMIYGPDGKLEQTVPMPSVPYCIFRHSGGKLWFGCKPGMLFREGGKSILDEPVYDIKEDSQGRLWIATFGHGIKRIDNPTDSLPVVSDSLAGRRVRKLHIVGDEIAATTTEGLLESFPFRPVRRDGNVASGLCSDATLDIARDSRGNYYISTESSGLDIVTAESLFSSSPEFRHVNMSNSSLTDDIIRAIKLDSDSLLMIVGPDKVTAYNPLTGESVTYGPAFWGDSVRFEQTIPVKLADGSWVFGAAQGALVATDHNLRSRGYVPPVVFTTLSVNGGAAEFSLPVTETLRLNPDQRNVTIGFAALDYIDNSGIRYRTRLDGSPWVTSGLSRNVTLFNLSPGEHSLEVQSTDRYGRWCDNTAGLTVTVAPFWYETWWAKTLFILLALAVVGGIVYAVVRMRRLSRQRRELLEKYLELMKLHSGNEPAPADEPHPSLPEQSPEDTAFLDRVRRYIENNLDNPDANVDDMAEAAAVSRSTLTRRLRSLMGISAAQLLIDSRMRLAARLLLDEPATPVADIATRCGYSDIQYFQRSFKKKHSLTPAEYRRGM